MVAGSAEGRQRKLRPDKAVEVLSELHDRYPRKTVAIGGRETALFDEPSQALAWLTATAGAFEADSLAASSQWTCVRGNPRRNAITSGGSPYLNRGWRVSTVTGATGSAENDAVVVRAFEVHRSQNAASNEEEPASPALSTMQPLIVGNLIVVRSVGDIRAYDVATEKLAWTTAEKDQLLLDKLQSGNGPQAQVPGGNPVAALLSNRCWEDTTFGTLS